MMNLLELYNNETIHMEKHPVSQLIGKVAELEKYHLKEQGITHWKPGAMTPFCSWTWI